MQDPTTAPSNPSPPKSPTRPHVHALSAVELAAERGIGPLSPLGLKSWHGEAYPCVSCGQLVRRSAIVCDQCGQDLSLKMIVKMQAYSGPWYVHEHVRPFPGVTLERLVRQAQRGVLTATTIVRGPTTYHQWRFAAETPALSKHLGLCWNCQSKVTSTDVRCGGCGVDLDNPPGESRIGQAAAQSAPPPPPPPAATTPRAAAPRTLVSPPPPADASDFERIRAALNSTPAGGSTARRGLPVVPIIAAILVVAIVILFLIVRTRSSAPSNPPSATPAATTPAFPSPAGAAPAESAAPAEPAAEQPPSD